MRGPCTNDNSKTVDTSDGMNGGIKMASEDSVVTGLEPNGCSLGKDLKDSQKGKMEQPESTESEDKCSRVTADNVVFDNSYSGYEPPAGASLDVERIPADISAADFFYRYIATRKPVVISGPLRDSDWKGVKWTNQYLRDKAGDAPVIVEQRGVTKESSFGLAAPKIHMRYGEFVENVMKGNDRLYMTTQDLERFEDDLDDHDMPRSVLAEPLKSLQEDFPTRPQLLSNLIPYQLSLWHGVAKNGTSSGLHHDYHDNLYVLLRGRKRFRLFAPSAAKHMRTAGIIAKIHSNGLIVYRNKPDDPTVVVRSDGVPMSFLATEKRDEAESDLASAENALEKLQKSTLSEEIKAARRTELENRREDAERRMDEAMDAIILYGCTGDVCSESDESESENHQEEPQTKRPRIGDSESSADFVPKMPDHFCDMNFPTHTDDPKAVFAAYPHLQGVGCINCDLQAGDMLYLPASWFHEVTSYSDPIKQSETETETDCPVTCSDDIGHLAFNYWMYPPDNSDMEQPYQHDFWPSRWEQIQRGPPLPIQKVWSSDSEEEDEEAREEEEEEEENPVDTR